MEPAPFAPDAAFLLLAAAVAVAYTAEAATGFGSIVIAVTLGAQLYPIPALLPLLLPLSLLLTTWVVLRNREHVDLALLGHRVLPWMAVGLAAGFAFFVYAPVSLLTPLLGVFVVGVSVLELRRLVLRSGEPGAELGPLAFRGVMMAAGLVQGAAASGGPVLVYALGRLGLPKARFRATLALVWLSLNTALVLSYLATGRLGTATLPWIALLVPVVAGSFALGNWLHHRLDEAAFRKAVLVLLAVAGVGLVV